jgi:hypothetical protein
MGYAISGVLVPLQVANYWIPKPWHKADRGRACVCAQYSETPDAEGCDHHSRAEVDIPGGGGARAEFALVNAQPILFTAGQERTKAFPFSVE